MLLTALGAFLGAVLSLLVTVYIENQKKPKLNLKIEPPFDREKLPTPVNESRTLRVYVTNKPMPKRLRWLGRSAAYQCTGEIQFYHLEDGAPACSRPMPIRWAGSEEPFSPQMLPDGKVVQLFDPAKYHASFRRDCFPGAPELVDVAARFDDDEDCYGWSSETYLSKHWPRNPDFQLSKGRYLVKVSIYSSGEPVPGVFILENSSSRANFFLLPASEGQAAKIRAQD